VAAIPKPVLIITGYYEGAGQQMSNISFWEVEDEPTTQADITAIAVAASTQMAAVYIPVMNENVNWVGVTAKYLSGTGILFSSDTTGAGPGTRNSGALPDQTAWTIDKQTAQYGRQYVGRYFIGGMDIDCLSASSPNETDTTAPAHTAMRALADFFGADKTFGASTCHARHWDRKSNSLIPVTKCAVRSKIASQRRRRRRALDLFLNT